VWNITPCWTVELPLFQNIIVSLKSSSLGQEPSFETLVTADQSKRPYIPEDLNFQQHRWGKLRTLYCSSLQLGQLHPSRVIICTHAFKDRLRFIHKISSTQCKGQWISFSWSAKLLINCVEQERVALWRVEVTERRVVCWRLVALWRLRNMKGKKGCPQKNRDTQEVRLTVRYMLCKLTEGA
jgi:hypothetical protein